MDTTTHAVAPDYRTYPAGRNTRQTPAQMDRKMEAARAHARTALRDLSAVLDDFTANSYRLTVAQRAEWRAAAEMHDTIAKALR